MKNVFLIGAMKCGTNTLYHALATHPEVATPKKKELDYFLKPGRDTSYSEHFGITADTRVTLDGTTQYSKYPQFRHSVESIRSMNPDARIVYLMRDPVDRYESNIAHHIAREEGISIDTWRDSKKAANALEYGRYYLQIGPFLNRFGPERVFLGAFEDFVADQTEFVRRLCEFIGIDSDGIRVPSEQRNPRRSANQAGKFRLSDEDERTVARTLQSDIDCLEVSTARDFASWWPRYRRILE